MNTVYDEKNKLWSNIARCPYDETQIPFGQRICRGLSLHKNKIAQINVDTGKHTTFHEMWIKMVRIAQNLQKRGFQSREVFSFMANYNDHLTATILASFCLACPVAPLHEELSKSELVRILRKIKPSVLFCDARFCDYANAALKESNQLNVKIFSYGGSVGDSEPFENLLIETGEENHFVPVEHDLQADIALIYCSSGTTGPSKCVCLSYGNDYFEFALTNPDSDGTVLSFEPIFWAASLPPLALCVVNGATQIITSKDCSAELQLNLIEKYKISVIFNIPLDLITTLKSDLIRTADTSSVKKIICYGGKMTENFIGDVHHNFPNATMKLIYALTETYIISTAVVSPNCLVAKSQLYYGCSVKIVDNNENRCGPNASGEICLQRKSDQFIGYLNDPQATTAAIDNEGFFRTGDCGHFDDDGYLTFEDRIKNIILVYYFGHIIIPSEIEEYLVSMMDIEEVCVVGIPIVGGESLPAALVVKKSNSNLSKGDVFQKVAEHFPDQSKLRGGIYFIESLPKTISGKIKRGKACELAIEWHKIVKEKDPEIQSYISDIPEEYRTLI